MTTQAKQHQNQSQAAPEEPRAAAMTEQQQNELLSQLAQHPNSPFRAVGVAGPLESEAEQEQEQEHSPPAEAAARSTARSRGRRAGPRLPRMPRLGALLRGRRACRQPAADEAATCGSPSAAGGANEGGGDGSQFGDASEAAADGVAEAGQGQQAGEAQAAEVQGHEEEDEEEDPNVFPPRAKYLGRAPQPGENVILHLYHVKLGELGNFSGLNAFLSSRFAAHLVPGCIGGTNVEREVAKARAKKQKGTSSSGYAEKDAAGTTTGVVDPGYTDLLTGRRPDDVEGGVYLSPKGKKGRDDTLKLVGAFHVGLEVRGQEWCYGYCDEGSGVGRIEPRSNQGHVYYGSIVLGRTDLSSTEVWELVHKGSRLARKEAEDALKATKRQLALGREADRRKFWAGARKSKSASAKQKGKLAKQKSKSVRATAAGETSDAGVATCETTDDLAAAEFSDSFYEQASPALRAQSPTVFRTRPLAEQLPISMLSDVADDELDRAMAEAKSAEKKRRLKGRWFGWLTGKRSGSGSGSDSSQRSGDEGEGDDSDALAKAWSGSSYSLTAKNCGHFARALVEELEMEKRRRARQGLKQRLRRERKEKRDGIVPPATLAQETDLAFLDKALGDIDGGHKNLLDRWPRGINNLAELLNTLGNAGGVVVRPIAGSVAIGSHASRSVAGSVAPGQSGSAAQSGSGSGAADGGLGGLGLGSSITRVRIEGGAGTGESSSGAGSGALAPVPETPEGAADRGTSESVHDFHSTRHSTGVDSGCAPAGANAGKKRRWLPRMRLRSPFGSRKSKGLGKQGSGSLNRKQLPASSSQSCASSVATHATAMGSATGSVVVA